MKLGKKKKTDDDSKVVNEADGGKKARPTKGSGGIGPGRLQWSLAGVSVLAGLATALLLYVLVVGGAEREAWRQQQEAVADQLAQRFEQRRQLVEAQVGRYASLARTAQRVGTEDAGAHSVLLKALFPAVQQVFIFPEGRVVQPAGRDFELSFASMDLARRAAKRQTTQVDAFRQEDRWLFQVASPVIEPDTGQMLGSLLVLFDETVFRPALGTGGSEGGGVALVQRAAGTERSVITLGDTGGESIQRDLETPNWTLRYYPPDQLPALISRPLLLGVPVVLGLLGAVLVVLLFSRFAKALRSDLLRLNQWVQKAFNGERARLPAMQVAMMGALGETLQRMAQATEKRIQKAESAAREKAKASPQPTPAAPAAAEADGEPLFQEKDMLDIDMLEGDEDVLGLNEEAAAGGMAVDEAAPLAVEVPPGIFRAYDIRGVVGESLSADIVRAIGQAIGSEGRSRGVERICVGYDGRDSSPELAEALCQGLMQTGLEVIEVGRVPTPVLYFAAYHLKTGSGVMVTGSHNPPDYNGLKMMLGGETLAGEAIQRLLQRIQTGDLTAGQGSRSQADVREDYISTITNDIAVAAPLKVVVDAGNGVAGELGPRLLEELGCEVLPLFCEVDGSFPNHHPDPGKPENLQALIEKVRSENADLGVAFDGDGDRLGVVTNTGKIIWPDRLLMLFARDVVSRNPGADIIYDVKCTRRLANVVNEFGGRPIMWRTGHSWIKARMKETGALLAGEMSGHIFFAERWYGFDDGIYSAARLLEILGIEDRSSEEVFGEFPEDVSTPELNIRVTDENKFDLVERLAREGNFGDGNLNDIDGVRVDYPDGWGLCRASNTTPMLVLRFEAETEEALERIKSVFREQLGKVDPELAIDF